MLKQSFVKNEYVIEINNHKRINEWSKDIIHQPHKCGKSICKTKKHNQPFKQTFLKLECSLPYICWINWYLVIPRSQINFFKELSPPKLVQEVINMRNWTSFFHKNFALHPLINTISKSHFSS